MCISWYVLQRGRGRGELLIIEICSWCKQAGFARSRDLQFDWGIDWRPPFLEGRDLRGYLRS